MSDSSVRHGPPVPPPATSTRPPRRASARPVGSRPAPDSGVARARTRARAHGRSQARTADRLLVTLVTCLLVAGALWLDRDLPAPAGAYGIVPQPGAATVAAPAPLEVGGTIPNFLLRSTAGDSIELAGLRGQPVILTFWTTWCLACLDQLPEVQQVADAHGDVQVLGIAVGEPSGRVSSAADDHGATFPILLDADKEVAHTYGYWDYPVTLVIDADGVIVAIHHGPLSAEEMEGALATAT